MSGWSTVAGPGPSSSLNLNITATEKERVAYFFNETSAKFHYGEGHPMKPARIGLAHNLIVGYGLHKKMSCFSQRRATEAEMTEFHSEDYIEFLRRVTPDNANAFSKFLPRFSVGVDDCPVFEGMYDFFRLSAGGSIEASRKLCAGTDIAINWAGGLHHAKKFEASGFCYVNDIVLGILQMLRIYPRVVYIDIDVHHGDGVQEAFYQSDRVMTVSFHRYDGSFFPGTGSLDEIGIRGGRNYSVNVPLQEHIDDTSYAYIFEKVIQNVMDVFQPSAIVLQCGADSLAGDRLGSFNLSIKGHGACVAFMKKFKLPMLVLGGGGYTIRNVARAWAYETSICTNTELPNELPPNQYYSHYGPDFRLHSNNVDRNADNANTRQYLDQVRAAIAENLRNINWAPSVAMNEIPPDIEGFNPETGAWELDEMEDKNPEMRVDQDKFGMGATQRLRREKESNEYDERELYADDADQDRAE
ncbi:histone deacetylase [Entophlyctis luteolus]|nr:histone deacetylase [Entophlyctis luteolus]KAJ3353153.1 histone deacetylase [Entophlyctis luteolus]KAJ3390001.1 histone deacetylase [Entophlyctis sp. JEL0112]